jgi:protein-tyrosine phosphatase
MAEIDLSWVTPGLALGGRIPTALVESLALVHGIRRVVDLRVEDKDDVELFGRHGIAFLHLPTDDACAVSQDHLDAGVEWVGGGLARGDHVLVHCQHGIGRSALLTCCVLVADGLDPSEALARIKRARPVVSPSPPQLEALLEWTARHRPDLLVAFDVLARIAYGSG